MGKNDIEHKKGENLPENKPGDRWPENNTGPKNITEKQKKDVGFWVGLAGSVINLFVSIFGKKK